MVGIDLRRLMPNQTASPITIIAIPISQMPQSGAVLMEDRKSRSEIEMPMGNAARKENHVTTSSLLVFSYFSPPAIRASSIVSMFIFGQRLSSDTRAEGPSCLWRLVRLFFIELLKNKIGTGFGW
jgi:hypothetical protein